MVSNNSAEASTVISPTKVGAEAEATEVVIREETEKPHFKSEWLPKAKKTNQTSRTKKSTTRYKAVVWP